MSLRLSFLAFNLLFYSLLINSGCKKKASEDSAAPAVNNSAPGAVVSGEQPDASSGTAGTALPTYDQAVDIVSSKLDIAAPQPGNTGQISFSSVLADRATVSWTKATDNKSSAGNLRYIVYYSLQNNINTVSAAEFNGTAAGSYLKDISSQTLMLAEGTTYFINVIVKDEANNAASYKTGTITTSYLPIAGNSGIISASQIGPDVELTWTKATAGGGGDSSTLKYSLYLSDSENLDSVDSVVANGTLYAFANDISTLIITEPGPSKRIFYNIIIEDTNGNRISYQQSSFDTNAEIYISYVDYTNRDLKFAKFKDNVWADPTLVNAAGDFYVNRTSIIVDSSGTAHIAYYESVARDLWYSEDSSGIFINSIAASTSNVGLYPSMVLNQDEKPYIVAYDSTSTDLFFYFQFFDIWGQQTALSNANQVGQFPSMDLDSNGKVHIASYDATADDLLYTTNASGNWVTVQVDTGGDVGSYSSLKIDAQNNVHISYYDTTNTNLKYATNASGSWVTENADAIAAQGLFTSLAIASDNTVLISYYSTTDTKLMLTSRIAGSWVREVVDGAGASSTGATGVALALDALDRPHIAYQDSTSTKLRHATRATPTTPWVLTDVDDDANNLGREAAIAVK